MKGHFLRAAALIVAVTCLLFIVAGCRRATSDNEGPDYSGYHPEKPPANDFERALRDVREAHFKFMWVFTRLDGQPFTNEDTVILHTNAQRVVDWVGTADQKTFVAGSNFDIEPAKMAVLKKRYKIDDYSGK